MRINTNISAMNAGRMLVLNSNLKTKTTAKLSSGLKINSAADDAAGLSISEKMRAQIRGMQSATQNVQDAVSLVQVGDGALQEITSMLNRVRELSVQSASDTNTEQDRQAMQMEVTQLINEIDIQMKNTNFNGIPLFDGSHAGTYGYAYGLKNKPTITPMDPAYIFANQPFDATPADPIVISQGTQASQTISASSTHLQELNGTPPTFPLEGVFIIRVQIPGSPPESRDAILDFENENTDGLFNLDDFREFFIGENTSGDPANPNYVNGAFSDWINEGEISINITDAGAITVETAGSGGSEAQVTIGATSGVPAGKILANSALLGASDSASYYDYAYKTSLSVTSQTELNALSQQDLWDALPHPITITYQLSRYSSQNPTLPNSVMTFSTAGCATLQDFNNLIQSNIKPEYYSSVNTLGLNRSVDRSGNVHVSFSNLSASPNSAYQGTYYVSTTTPPSYKNATSTPPSVTSDYVAAVSDRAGTLEITISGIPTNSGTKSAKVQVDFANKKVGRDADGDGVADTFESFVDTGTMAAAIEKLLNDTANHPDTNPIFTSSGYDTNKPVAKVGIDSNNKLVITAAERTFSISVNEYQSDIPMFYNYRYSTSGVSQSCNLRIDGTPGANIAIASGEYTSIDDFIQRNAASFHPNYILRKDDSGTKLVIESTAEGYAVDVSNIRFTSPSPTTPADLLSRLGFANLTANDPSYFVDGVTHPAVSVEPNGLWIQSGANTNEGMLISIPCLSAYDLGLMIKAEDLAFPDGPHRADGGVNGGNSIAGSGGVNMGTASYSAVANISSVPMGYGLDISTRETANAAIEILDNAINIIVCERSQFGAAQNRLESTSRNLDNGKMNLTSAESRIRDADMAKEMMQLTKQNILTQANTAMLAQANTMPEMVLQLLR